MTLARHDSYSLSILVLYPLREQPAPNLPYCRVAEFVARWRESGERTLYALSLPNGRRRLPGGCLGKVGGTELD